MQTTVASGRAAFAPTAAGGRSPSSRALPEVMNVWPVADEVLHRPHLVLADAGRQISSRVAARSRSASIAVCGFNIEPDFS